MYRLYNKQITKKDKGLHLRLSLAVIWSLGLVIGYYLASRSKPVISSLILLIQSDRMMIVGFLSMLILPFIVSAILIWMSLNIWVLPLAFLKACLYSCCCCQIMVFGDAGWLAHLLFVFSESISVPILLWFWFSCIDEHRGFILQRAILCIASVMTIGCVDCFIVSPFAAKLF